MANKMCFYFVPLFFLHFLVASSSLAMTRRNIVTDQSALLAFKNHITDPYGILANNWSVSNPVCNWVGISCNTRHGRVTALELPFMNLGGTIPPHLGNLSFLAYLNIHDNHFHGHLPYELARLRRLRLIRIGDNYLSGDFPLWIGNLSALQYLNIYNNSFTGTIPHSLFNLSKLETLVLSNNNIQGNIPSGIGELTNLHLLAIASSKLSGSIPAIVYNISSIQHIDLRSNELSGSLPSDICDHLPKLTVLHLENNELSGMLPASLSDCSELRELSLWGNEFTGTVPHSIFNLSDLEMLYLAFNNIRGNIPAEIGKLTNLVQLDLASNNFSGSIPSAIYNISSLEEIDLSDNNLFGSLPPDICNHLPRLEELYLAFNELSGKLPASLGDCNELRNLSLSDNKFTGEIPDKIGNLINLEFLGLQFNHLNGLIPQTIFNITSLKFINLNSNDLSGHLPSSIGDSLPNLEWLFMGINKLSGTIPKSITNASKLVYLELVANSFSGLIPNTFDKLKLLRALNLGYNNLTTKSSIAERSFLSSLTNCGNLESISINHNPLYDILPSSIGNLSSSLRSFWANDCRLMGRIPKEIGKLHGLIDLKLYNNDLNGSIPKTVGKLQNLQGLYLDNNNMQRSIPNDLCQLERLDSLSLNDNKLSGSIPSCIGNLTSLRKVDLSSNKFTSIIPSSLWTLKYILLVNLSSNSLSGSLSLNVQNLKVLNVIDLSRNQLSGEIPTLGNLDSLVILSLENNKFDGHIPNSFVALLSLQSLDLSSNNLSGEIPKSLEKLSYLEHFNVSMNRLEGEIPTKGPFRNFTAKSFMLNYALCGPPRLQVPPCKYGTIRGSKRAIVLKYILPPIMSTVLIMIAIIFIRCHDRRANPQAPSDILPLTTWRRISYIEIQRATDDFSDYNLLGRGSFGSVYKGILSDGANVAIKVFNLYLESAFKSFDSECEVLRNIRHRNLIKVFNSCSNPDFKALVLEFISNGSLEKWLYSHNYFLDILERLNIMIDVASALEYLHHDHSTPIVHCDLKPSNILIDDSKVAHVSDFGISKLLGEGNSMTHTMTIATIGYMAPEYGSMGIVSPKGDVYSYGILLLEVFTRKKPTDEMFSGGMSLNQWVKNSLPHAVTEVVDNNLLQDLSAFSIKVDCISSIMNLAVECCMELPEQRINMKDALAKLQKIRIKFVNAVEIT